MSQVGSLRNVSGCVKPGCKALFTQRHHRKHQAMWLGVWSGRRAAEMRWKQFVIRYHEFREEDCDRICAQHHAEIHRLYDRIIRADIKRTGKSLAKYSWRQAETLMDKLEAACLAWLKKETPGIDPKTFEQRRKARKH